MSHCFLLGSEKDARGRRRLEILQYIEYLTYDLENRRVDVWADFFVENVSDRRTFLCGLHRGNIIFEATTERWLNDGRWTRGAP